MKIIHNNPLNLSCANGETITVSVQATNTAHLVNCSLDGAGKQLHPGEDFVFSAYKKTADTPISLLMAFNFSEARGSYSVKVRGNQGGDVSQIVVKPSGWTSLQLTSLPPNPVVIEFRFLPGDPTTPATYPPRRW